MKMIAEKLGGYSISLGKNVSLSTPVTVLVENKPVDEVLKAAIGNMGYAVDVDPVSKTIVISPAPLYGFE